jgi:hypothetical protein
MGRAERIVAMQEGFAHIPLLRRTQACQDTEAILAMVGISRAIPVP